MELLPYEVTKQSISQRELVLPFEEAIKAIDIIERNNKIIFAWEGWVLHRDGSHGHHKDAQGTIPFEQQPNQSHANAVKQSAEFARQTISDAHKIWQHSLWNRIFNRRLYFCLSFENET